MTIGAWGSLALGIVQLLNWVTQYLDEQTRQKVVGALINAENLKLDEDAIKKAREARAGVERDLAADPGRVRAPDEFQRD